MPQAADGAGQDSAGEEAAGAERAGPRAPGQPPTSRQAVPGPLPEAVRHRVISMAADALGVLPPDEVPAALRPFARFTPSRRARLAATPLAAALEHDASFRERIADRVRLALPDLIAALETGTPPAAADPLDVAAVAYLLRSENWDRLVSSAGAELERVAVRAATDRAEQAINRLQDELTASRAAAKAETDKLRGELDAVRREAEDLRRRLRKATDVMRRAEHAAREAENELAGQRGQVAAVAATAESENRRLRNRLGEAEAALEASRRAAREGRSLEDMRVRLLLDTVLEAAQGLRRELALPPVSTRPADTVEAMAPPASGPGQVAARAMAADDPALLDQLLALPQAHLVVDGYNVTKTGYPALSLSEQRLRLLGGLAVLAAQSGAEITCVFDGADLATPVPLTAPRKVRVLFSRPGETADELIRRLVRAEPPGRAVTVVSTDREVADGVRAAGARPVPATMLLRRLARG
jgi:predicted RNA-binding protein with PIN domain